MSSPREITILDLFDSEQLAGFKERSDGSLVGECPSCGKGGDSYGGFIINPKTNTCYCFGSKTTFDITETMYLLKGFISCFEGRSKI